MKWIGLTGGIATGKSAAKNIIEKSQYPVVDADLIAHEITKPNQLGYEKVVSTFGSAILNNDKTIDRKKLGEIIFKSEDKKLVLEGLLHPIIQAEVQQQKLNYKNLGHKICFYDVPLLFEKKLQNQFDKIVLIWCDPQIQFLRLKERNQLTDQQALDRIQSQLPLSEKLPLSSYCIDNSTSLNSLGLQLRHLFMKL